MHRSNLTRRGFLKGAGIAAAGAALRDTAVEALAQETKPSSANVFGPDAVPLTLNMNGADKSFKVEPATTLAELLRIHADLTGTKIVCDRGACSACTVWIDNVPTLSCMTLALDARGREITTIEGLAQGEKLHPVQEQFIEHDAMQCGFCTPGMIMSCVALLQKNKNPSLDDVKTATSGNICRCGTYPKVFDAVLAAAKQA